MVTAFYLKKKKNNINIVFSNCLQKRDKFAFFSPWTNIVWKSDHVCQLNRNPFLDLGTGTFKPKEINNNYVANIVVNHNSCLSMYIKTCTGIEHDCSDNVPLSKFKARWA